MQLIRDPQLGGDTEHLLAGAAGGAGPVDQAIEVRVHEPDEGALRDVPREDHALRAVVDPHHGARHALAADRIAHREGEQEAARRQVLGVLAQVPLVELQRASPVQLIEDVARGAGDQPLGPKRIPAAHRAVADPQAIAIEAEHHAAALGHRVAGADEGMTETFAVARPPSGGGDARRKGGGETPHEIGAVDAETVREDEGVHQPGVGDGVGQLAPGGQAVAPGLDRHLGGLQLALLQLDRRDHHRIVPDLLADDLARRRAAADVGIGIASANLGEARGDHRPGGTEHQRQIDLGGAGTAGLVRPARSR